MAKVTFNTLSHSNNKEDLIGETQSGAENDMLEQNKWDEQQITKEGGESIEDGMETVKENKHRAKQ
eukprot:3482805-Ditylum_brightwellii.AAC.1